MTHPVIVTGTDTGIGKTVFSAGLTQALGAQYWKPVQAGLEEETDSQAVARLSGQPVLPEAWRLSMPASPHIAAKAENLEINPSDMPLPETEGPLVVEAAGGLMVPLTDRTLYLDVIADWSAPVILCARTALGTINHSLLSLQALRAQNCTVIGVVFIGNPEPQVEQTITHMGAVAHLGRLAPLSPLSSATLAKAFDAIDMDMIKKGMSL